jgi:hypothetical protein
LSDNTGYKRRVFEFAASSYSPTPALPRWERELGEER